MSYWGMFTHMHLAPFFQTVFLSYFYDCFYSCIIALAVKISCRFSFSATNFIFLKFCRDVVTGTASKCTIWILYRLSEIYYKRMNSDFCNILSVSIPIHLGCLFCSLRHYGWTFLFYFCFILTCLTVCVYKKNSF